MCLVSFAALLPEFLLAYVFQDNRVAHNRHKMLDMCWAEFRVVEGLDTFVLDLIGSVLGKAPWNSTLACLSALSFRWPFLRLGYSTWPEALLGVYALDQWSKICQTS